MSKLFTITGAILISAVFTFNAQAACTYSEAVMAFNNGNLVRGQALMKMAARDGDQRAVRFLAKNDVNNDQNKGEALSELLLVMDSQDKPSMAEKLN